MWEYPDKYDVIVMGGGHAGCEAAFASAKMGAKTLLLTMNLDTIGKMSCNPAVGGIGKGHMVREIDALGGLMGKLIDATGIQFRMLNATKGPAVWAPRAQADKFLYAQEAKFRLEKTPNLEIKQGTIEEILAPNGVIAGVITKEGIHYHTKTLIISSGTFMRGLLHIGEKQHSGGRAGDQPAVGLSASLEAFGIKLGRLKTGTPPRIHRRSIDFSLTEEQPGEENIRFSFDEEEVKRPAQISCYITYTTKETKEIILNNLHRSAMYSGRIQSVGPRYCPSIEDKMVRFADKERHQLFLEPEGLTTDEIYVNGVSSSMPLDVQLDFIRSIPALRNAEIMRPAYAIEYDYVESGQMTPSLESKKIEGLFFAGQINGTTGYEEAAGQGIMAGINAASKLKGIDPLVFKRSEAYIGVMIDDLCTKGLTEPYRMFTSRAEHRLLLRQDNADLRLREYGYKLGLIDDNQHRRLLNKKKAIEEESFKLSKIYKTIDGKGVTLAQILCRPEITYSDLLAKYPEDVTDYGEDTNLQIELNLKYAGYIDRQNSEIAKHSHIESIRIPKGFDFKSVTGLRNEAKEKLSRVSPETLAQASRISGVSPADITVLIIALSKRSKI
ncbi:tRNA uridine-5-carboxymethylaminomethyl(34) synthesis enzyme MnmG [Criblamydia sequanensis]|uniref:tRNA uridine 5-carboxymethylaminomethyl modification enzyme MnmG n=1 Tax=Candidatus Criblamydia sequanensis CRIB-18 TaxID=1437425 RepID=A0A090E0W0_9BACT|nr:tRNA uridine-5-carboxymethylaminomethyl(34) synthesis enzyme MnmG [Criblamydia sequanensis]CDR34429.1 tRNA uridine 5-carboxymethylaminomethyl modification enzyme GidA [Criblamydia sequanensis CRIB-18]